ncbi:hypothetical protein P262_04003 [Cronobacter malonaticus]|uniref:Uncharacterized protein n=1 Tax=Cronobacter malonaticus TaxID=413503 RepID=V5U256_9ENTR|nr:hypothetical protein P262_04003 [Cronobacter malonaticus]
MSVSDNLKMVSKAGQFLANQQKKSAFIKRGGLSEGQKNGHC